MLHSISLELRGWKKGWGIEKDEIENVGRPQIIEDLVNQKDFEPCTKSSRLTLMF